jgi:peptide/nickel transport system permease protein
MKRLKKLNLPLIFGGIIIIFIVFVMIFPQAFTKTNPYGIKGTQMFSSASGSLKVKGAPFPPSRTSPLGTDDIGRDLFSFMVYGTRLTITLSLLVVLFRFVLAVPLGMAAGFGSSTCRAIINEFNIIFSAIPALILCAIILSTSFFRGLYKRESIIAFVIVLTLAGWAKVGLIIMERTKDILSKNFIGGETAIGKSRFKIAVENVLPHISPELLVLFFMEIAMALAMLMQLGIFGVFVGNLRLIASDEGGVVTAFNISYEPEWASMLSTSIGYISTSPIMVLAPAAAFFTSILGFNLFGEGLRTIVQKEDSMFPYYFRRTFSLNSLTHSSKKFKKAVPAFAIALIAVFCFTSYAGNRKNAFSSYDAASLLSSKLPDKVIMGTSSAEATAHSLEAALKKLDFKPLDSKGYITEYSSLTEYAPVSSSLKLESNGKTKSFREGIDYSFLTLGSYNLSGKIFDARTLDIYSVKDFSIFNDKFVLLSDSLYTESAVKFFSDALMHKSRAKGILYIISSDKDFPYSIVKDTLNIACIYIKESLLKDIDLKTSVADISLSSQKLRNTGRNVLGILPGSDPNISKEAIIIGTGYDYMSYESSTGKSRIMLALELAKKLKSQKNMRNRSIILAFWDGNLSDSLNGINKYARNPLYPPLESVLYLDLTNLRSDKNSILCINSEKSPISRYFAWTFNHQLETELQKSSISIKKVVNSRTLEQILAGPPVGDEGMYYTASVPSIDLSTKETYGNQNIDIDKLGSIILNVLQKNDY